MISSDTSAAPHRICSKGITIANLLIATFGGASVSSSKHRHERDSCRNIRRPRPRKRARTTCSETRHDRVPDGQSVFSFQQHCDPCADFQAVEVLSQMKTYSDQQRNESLPTQTAMPMSRQPTEVYLNDTNGACYQNSSEGIIWFFFRHAVTNLH